MIKSKKSRYSKKVVSGIAVLALTAAASIGTAVAFIAAKNHPDLSDIKAVHAATSDNVALGNPHNKISGKTYYVSPDAAKNGDGDGSKSKPYNILDLLNDNGILKPGDTVLLAAGEYKLGIRDQEGSTPADQRITITFSGSNRGYITIKPEVAGSQVTLNFSDMNFSGSNRGVSIYGDYIYWYDIDVMGAGDNGLYIGGSYNIVEDCEFYNNRDTGLQLGRSYSDDNGAQPQWNNIDYWPSYNVIKNCTSHNNYDNETYGENADGFAAKLTVGYGNVFDGCIAYRNSDDGWDLFAKVDSGNIGSVILYNCVAFENGFLEYTCNDFNATMPAFDKSKIEPLPDSYVTQNGDGNGFKLGGESMEADVFAYNCLSFNNRMNGFTDNSNPGYIQLENCTSYNNSAVIDPDSGKVVKGKSDETHGNIDVSRQTYSYNSISRVLGISNEIVESGSLSADVVRGSAQYSILDGKVKIGEYIDADVKNNITGTAITPLVASEVFEKLPITISGSALSYNINGADDGGMNATSGIMTSNNRVHLTYRNDDGSINMGNILKIKDYSKLFGDSNKIGSDLTATSWDNYKHYYSEDLSKAGNLYEATALAVKDALYITAAEKAVYQDFDIPSAMMGAQISWTSSNTDVISFTKYYNVSDKSGAEYVKAIVNRPAQDTEVKLTANINYRGVTQSRQFTVNVKARVFKIGAVGVENYIDNTTATISSGKSGVISIEAGSTIIVDKYAIFTEPRIFVNDGSDYNGKRLDSSLYDVETVYEYSPDGMSGFNDNLQEVVHGITTARAGTFRITHNVRPKGNTSATPVSFSYYVNVASTSADNVQFLGDPVVTVNRDGFTLKGKTTNGIGEIYALSLNAAQKAAEPYSGVAPTAQQIMTNGKKITFRTDDLTAQFENPNSEAYSIYYVFANGMSQHISEVKSAEVGVVNIDSEAAFMTLTSTGKIGSEIPSQTIYKLTKDLDYTSAEKAVGNATFSGLFNGGGHTIKNIELKDQAKTAGIFKKVDGGTIMNVTFENIDIKNTGNQLGIIATMTSGYVSGVQLKNVKMYSDGNSVGGLIGQATSNEANSKGEYTPGDIHIDRVGVYGCNISAKGGRIGGIMGAAQVSGTSTTWLTLDVQNCVIDDKTEVGSVTEDGGVKKYGAEYAGGAFGRLQNQHKNNLYIFRNIYSAATVRSEKNGCGGIVAAFNNGFANGLGQSVLENCVFSGQLFFGNFQEALTEPQKNCSGIVGKYADGIELKDCASVIEEFYDNYKPNVNETELDYMKATRAFWTLKGYDFTNTWIFKNETSSESRFCIDLKWDAE